MELADLIARDAILPAVKAGSKKQILHEIGARAREAYGLDTRLVVEGLLAREKLGSTAMGGGVAIPHARLEGLKSIAGLFARLERPADFEAVDGQGVDLVFVLLAPEGIGRRPPARPGPGVAAAARHRAAQEAARDLGGRRALCADHRADGLKGGVRASQRVGDRRRVCAHA